MERLEVEHASCSDESEEEHGLQNAYSVGDLLGELSSDSDDGRKDPECADDPTCPGSNVPVNSSDYNVVSEKPGDLNADLALEGEALECSNVSDSGGGSITVADTYSRVYDEVFTENIYQDPVEIETHNSKYVIDLFYVNCFCMFVFVFL